MIAAGLFLGIFIKYNEENPENNLTGQKAPGFRL